MTITELTELLRERFRKADTIGELLRIARDAGVPFEDEHGYVGLFQRAFGYVPGGWYAPNYTESFGNGKEPDSYLDRVHLRDILARRDRWDLPADQRPPAWYDGLTCRTFRQLVQTGRYHALEPQDTDDLLAAQAAARRHRIESPVSAAA